jgi:wyosine [tRNA(Phe)-imidazoG37] synthetase (radical SAM superfamily)
LLHADLVIPSLDAGNDALFRLVNRPHDCLGFERMLSGLIDFRRRFPGRYWLEVFLVHAYSTSETGLSALRRCVDLIRPERVQLNTVSRSPAEDYAAPVPREPLKTLAAAFSPPAEIIADFPHPAAPAAAGPDRELILALLRRRPCSREDIASGLGMHPAEIVKVLDALCTAGLVEVARTAERLQYRTVRNVFFQCVTPSTPKEMK